MTPLSDNWKPTAALHTLSFRAELLHSARNFFREQNYLEVETPICSQEIINDAHIEPISVQLNETGGNWFLQTSPEACMKRLLSAGAERIFQFAHAFRAGEISQHHNSEFTMLEWYAVGESELDQMQFVQELVLHVYETASQWFQKSKRPPCSFFSTTVELLKQTIPLLTYDQAFERAISTPVLHLTAKELKSLAQKFSLSIPESLPENDRDGWLNLLLVERVEPMLKEMRAVFLCDYPASQSALAKVDHQKSPVVAKRFELYLDGVEICNGYNELTDANELSERMQKQNDIREQEGNPLLPEPTRLLAAMQAGLPSSAGVALGWDRLIMLAGGYTSIQDVLPFPFDRA